MPKYTIEIDSEMPSFKFMKDGQEVETSDIQVMKLSFGPDMEDYELTYRVPDGEHSSTIRRVFFTSEDVENKESASEEKGDPSVFSKKVEERKNFKALKKGIASLHKNIKK